MVGLADEILATLNSHVPHRRAVQFFDAQMIPEKVFTRAPYRGNFDHLFKRKGESGGDGCAYSLTNCFC